MAVSDLPLYKTYHDRVRQRVEIRSWHGGEARQAVATIVFVSHRPAQALAQGVRKT